MSPVTIFFLNIFLSVLKIVQSRLSILRDGKVPCLYLFIVNYVPVNFFKVQCRLMTSRNGNVPSYYYSNFHVDYFLKSPVLPVDFKR